MSVKSYHRTFEALRLQDTIFDIHRRLVLSLYQSVIPSVSQLFAHKYCTYTVDSTIQLAYIQKNIKAHNIAHLPCAACDRYSNVMAIPKNQTRDRRFVRRFSDYAATKWPSVRIRRVFTRRQSDIQLTGQYYVFHSKYRAWGCAERAFCLAL